MKDLSGATGREAFGQASHPVHHFREAELLPPGRRAEADTLNRLQKALENNDPVTIAMESLEPSHQTALHALALEMFARAENSTGHPTTSKLYVGLGNKP